MAKVEIDGKQKELEILVITKRTNPLLGLDWMKKLGITLEMGKTVPQIQQIKEDQDITSLKTKFKKLYRKPYGKRTGSKDTTKRRREIDTTERKANTDSPSTIGGEGNRKTNKTRIHRKS